MSPTERIEKLAQAKGCDPRDLMVCVLERPRHQNLIEEIRATGARLRLITDGDVAGVIHCANTEKTGVDIYMGSGGAPEGVLAAAKELINLPSAAVENPITKVSVAPTVAPTAALFPIWADIDHGVLFALVKLYAVPFTSVIANSSLKFAPPLITKSIPWATPESGSNLNECFAIRYFSLLRL